MPKRAAEAAPNDNLLTTKKPLIHIGKVVSKPS